MIKEYTLKVYGVRGRLIKEVGTTRLVYETHRRRNLHFHRSLNAWGISMDIYEDLLRLGCDGVRIVLMGEKSSLYAEIADFVKHGQRYTFVENDTQVFLKEKFWKVIG